MKNQYFGDVRDLFKYDLIQEIMQQPPRLMQQPPRLRQFTFIPMLTKNDNKTDGNNRITDAIIEKGLRAGTQNIELIKYLRKDNEIKPEDRNFIKIRKFFTDNGIPTEIFNPAAYKPEDYFTQGKRREYFSGVPESSLESALVFVDPDNGLEVKKPSGKHLQYSEVRALFERMSDDSILMIYQHFPRENHDKYINRRVQELRDVTKENPLWISDNEIIFFFVAKNDRIRENLKCVLSNYSGRYEKCRSGCD